MRGRIAAFLGMLLTTIGLTVVMTTSPAFAEPTPCGASGQTLSGGTGSAWLGDYTRPDGHYAAEWGWYRGGGEPAGCHNMFIGRVNNAACGYYGFVGWRAVGALWYESLQYTCFDWRYGPLYPSNGIPQNDWFAIDECLDCTTIRPAQAISFWIDY